MGSTGIECDVSTTIKIGNTPMVDLSALSPNENVKIFGKCEFLNPGMSMKDRIIQYILDDAEKSGKLLPGGTVVCASSGNTGASVAMICAMRGYKAIVITNTKCSKEKVDTLKAFNAKVIITKSGVPTDSPEHYQSIEIELCKNNPDYFGVNQYDNPLNPEAYYKSLAPEIWEQTKGQITHYVAAASTGGTISGVSKYLKERKPEVRCICPDPYGSIFYDYYSTGKKVLPKSFQVEGVGKDSIPENMNFKVIDDMPRVHDRDAFTMCRTIAEKCGLLVGGSAGLNVFAAAEVAKEIKGEALIVCILCDSGIKYLSKIYNDDWVNQWM